MNNNKTNIIIIDISDSHQKKNDDKIEDVFINDNNKNNQSSFDNVDNVYENNGSGNGNSGCNSNKKRINKVITVILIIIIVFLLLFIKKLFYNGNVNKIKQHIEFIEEMNNQEPQLYSDLYKKLLDGTMKAGERPISLLDKDLNLWIEKYGPTAFVISYNDLIASNVDFISDEFKNQYQVLVDLGLYDNFHYNYASSKECIDLIMKKLNDKDYFNNNVIIKDLRDIDKIYIVNKDRIVSVKEVENQIDAKPFLKIEMPYGTIINTRIEYRYELRDKIDNVEQFANDLDNLKTILNENKNDTLNGVVLYNDSKHNMLYLYKNNVGIMQSLSSAFNEKQKEEFFSEIEKYCGKLMNIDNKIVVNPKLIKSIRYDGVYVSLDLDGGFNSSIEKIKISDEAKNKLDGFAKENNIEIKEKDDNKEVTFLNSKAAAIYNKSDKEFITEDERKFYNTHLKQLKEILNSHKNDVLDAVVIDKAYNQNVIIYYFKNSEFVLKPLLITFSNSQKREFFYEIEKAMGDILILDDKVLLNPRLIRKIIYNSPYVTFYLDGGLNSILSNIELSQSAINKLQEWQKINNIP